MPRALLVKVKKDELFFSQMRAIWLGARPMDESWEQASKNSWPLVGWLWKKKVLYKTPLGPWAGKGFGPREGVCLWRAFALGLRVKNYKKKKTDGGKNAISAMLWTWENWFFILWPNYRVCFECVSLFISKWSTIIAVSQRATSADWCLYYPMLFLVWHITKEVVNLVRNW